MIALLAGCGPSLDDVVADAVADGFQGVIAVDRGPDVLALDAWGEAAPGVANTTGTAFDVGSITKQFTAAAVLEARDRGLLELDDPLSAHFDDVPRDRAGVTLHELLTHTGGFAPALGPDEEPIGRDEWLSRAWASDLGEPGRFEYSNVGYGLLAAVLEQRTGQSYEDVLRDWFFVPLGLEHTGYTRPDWEAVTVAWGYRRGEATPPLAPAGPSWHLVGNGGIVSTAADLRRWMAALAEGEVLTDASRADLWDHHVRTWPRAWYAYGWGVEDWLLMGWNVNHDGGNGSFYAHAIWWPEQELWVLSCTNHAAPVHEDLGWRLSRAVLR